MNKIPAKQRKPTPPPINRSWTDPVSNLMLLHQLDLRSALARLRDREALPQDALPSFLHESTHHWCFDSPVGLTLSLVTLRRGAGLDTPV